MPDLNLKLIEIIPHCCDVKTFRFASEREIRFKPGQYLLLNLDVGGVRKTKAFSISNSPSEAGIIQFTKKITDSDFSKALLNLKINTTYSLRLPLGRFTFEGEYPKVAFLSGGIGITPIRPIFKWATDQKLSSHMILLYSSRSAEYLLFKDDFSQMAQSNRNIKVVYTLTHCPTQEPGCRSGRIDEVMIKEEIPDYSERHFFVCGPPGMVDAMKRILVDKLSVSGDHIHVEGFKGYES